MKCLASRTTCAVSSLLAAVASASWGAPSVRLLPEATVKAAAMRLGDIAVIKADTLTAARLKAVEVGPAPLPGKSRPVGADYVRIRLRQARLDPMVISAESAKSCVVTRSSQTLSGDRLVDTARTYLQGAIEPGDGKLVIEPVSRPREMVLPIGDLAVSAELAGAPTTSATRRVAVNVTVDGIVAGKVDISLRVRRYAKVAIAAMPIPRGAMMTPEMVTYEERDCMSLPPDVYREGQSVDGLQAQQPIAAHRPLTRHVIAAPPVVHRGDAVTISAGAGGIHISLPGIAVEDGRVGEAIRVRNSSSNQEFRATVVDAKTVEAAI